jgi:hypothetical protein
MIFDFETHSGGLGPDNTTHLLLASISVAMLQTSRDTNPDVIY